MSETILIIGCSSGIGRPTASEFLTDGWDAYATVGQTVRQEDRKYGIDVVEPTVVATDHYDRMREELVAVDHEAAYTDLYELHEQLHTVKSDGPGIAAPEAVAETMLEAANSERPRRRYTVGSTGKVSAIVAAVLPEPWRTPLLTTGVRIVTSSPVKRILKWWFARHHRVDRPDPSERSGSR